MVLTETMNGFNRFILFSVLLHFVAVALLSIAPKGTDNGSLNGSGTISISVNLSKKVEAIKPQKKQAVEQKIVFEPTAKKITEVRKGIELTKDDEKKTLNQTQAATETKEKILKEGNADLDAKQKTAAYGFMSSYKDQLYDWIDQHKQYPRSEKRRKIMGSVITSFSIDEQGRLTSVDIVESSGSRNLDRAAIAAIRNSNPMPIPPKDYKGNLSFRIPLDFKIN